MSKIKTIDYKDWLLNQKRLPDKDSSEYEDFFEWHKELCLNGFYMEGEFINPFLYWHLNLWNTEVDVLDSSGRIQQKYSQPWFRDNEWVITNEIFRANTERKGLCIGGIRRLAKSVIEASYISWGATFDENSQNVVSGLNSPDIKLITDKIDKGLNFLPEYYRWQRIEDNWKNQVTLGIKTSSGQRMPFSAILIRNLDEGNNEEAIAGTKPRKLIIDEGGKGNFLRALKAAIPGFTTPYGWGCSPIVTFTGGDMKKFFDAKQLMFDVEAFNFLSYKNEKDSRRVHGLFIGHKYRMEAKVDSSLGAYLNKPEDSELYQIPMKVSDLALADKVTDETLEINKKAGDRQIYLKEKMYYPKEVDDIFLSEDTNIFDADSARAQQNRIKLNDIKATLVELFHDGDTIKHKPSDKFPITNFPVKSNDSKDAPIQIWEMPIKDAPFGLYTAGIDPYRQGQAKYSDSLGAVYIYKRMHSITSEKYQEMIVASYVARPKKREDWQEQARLLIKFYNARALCENDEMSFIDYMISKGDGHYLENQPQWIKEIVPNTTVERDKGIHRSSQKIIDFLHASLKEYTEEVVYRETDDKGSIIKEILGMNRVYDPMLLEEIIQFNEDINVDRIVAAELAIALAKKLNPLIGRAGEEDDKKLKSLFEKKKKSTSIFSSTLGIFKKPRSIFR